MDNQYDRIAHHLANERTYLAWLRTGLATMGFGVVIAKLKHVVKAADADAISSLQVDQVGAVLAMTGLLIVIMAARRYFVAQKHIEKGHYQPANALVMTITMLFVALSAAIIFLLLRT
jgi:putative membrane protein